MRACSGKNLISITKGITYFLLKYLLGNKYWGSIFCQGVGRSHFYFYFFNLLWYKTRFPPITLSYTQIQNHAHTDTEREFLRTRPRVLMNPAPSVCPSVRGGIHTQCATLIVNMTLGGGVVSHDVNFVAKWQNDTFLYINLPRFDVKGGGGL